MSDFAAIQQAKRQCIDWAGVLLELEALYPAHNASIEIAAASYEMWFHRYQRLSGESDAARR